MEVTPGGIDSPAPGLLSPDDLLLEVQDLLLGQGDTQALNANLATVRQALARRCPVMTAISQTLTTWSMGTYVAPRVDLDLHTGTYTDVTAAAQSAGVSPLVPLTTQRVGDGHLLGAHGMFEEVRYTLSVSAGADGLWTYSYWNGSDWRALTPLLEPFLALATTQTLRFVPPDDWSHSAPIDTVFPEDVDPRQYWLRVQTTVAPAGTPPQATQVVVQTAVYPLPQGVMDVLAVLWMPNEMEPAPVREGLDSANPTWFLQETAVPVRYTMDLSGPHRLRLAPRPQTLGTPNMPWLPGLFALDNVIVCATVDAWDPEQTPYWAEGLLAYGIAAHEARRIGETRNEFVAQSLEALSSGLIQLLHDLWREEGLELPQPWQSPLQKRVP